MAPLYPYIIILSIFTLYIFIKYFGLTAIRNDRVVIPLAVKFLVIAMILPFLAINVVKSNSQVEKNRLRGFQYDRNEWAESETISFLKNFDRLHDGIIFSDHPYPIYYYLNLSPVLSLPSKTHYYTGGDTDRLQKFIRQIAEEKKPVYIVWFGSRLPRHYTPSELRKVIPLELVEQSSDGAVYIVRNPN